MSYKIMHRHQRHFVLASGFYSLERAQQWIAKFDPRMWVDKTLRAQDLMIVNEKTGEVVSV